MDKPAKLYDLEIDLSSNDGAVPSTKFADWMRVRLYGHSVNRRLVLPVVVGSAYFFNDGDGDVQLRRGAALPITVQRGQIVHVMFDGKPDGMRAVGF